MLLTAIVLGLSGCSSEGAPSQNVEPSAQRASTTTATIAPQPPVLRAPAMARAEIGQRYSDALVASDPNGDDVTIEIEGRAPDGFDVIRNARGRITGFMWEPIEAGEWRVDLVATDSSGMTSTASIELVSRHQATTDAVLALGDSIAAGFGRDRSDLIAADPCGRSEADTYASRMTEILIEAGTLSPDTGVLVGACSGADSQAMLWAEVETTRIDGASAGESATQVDHATMINPAIITLTIGAQDMGLFNVEDLDLADANNDPDVAFDRSGVTIRKTRFERNLALILDALVTTTDAHVVVSNYYDPTAAIPVGVDGCRDSCMVELMSRRVAATNGIIEQLVSAQRPGRVSLAHLDGDADVWEAGNGVGPDVLREGLGPLQGVIDRVTGGAFALCADRGEPDRDLVSSLDCVHPNSAGHTALARAVADVLLAT